MTTNLTPINLNLTIDEAEIVLDGIFEMVEAYRNEVEDCQATAMSYAKDGETHLADVWVDFTKTTEEKLARARAIRDLLMGKLNYIK